MHDQKPIRQVVRAVLYPRKWIPVTRVGKLKRAVESWLQIHSSSSSAMKHFSDVDSCGSLDFLNQRLT